MDARETQFFAERPSWTRWSHSPTLRGTVRFRKKRRKKHFQPWKMGRSSFSRDSHSDWILAKIVFSHRQSWKNQKTSASTRRPAKSPIWLAETKTVLHLQK